MGKMDFKMGKSLLNANMGIEREALRVNSLGNLALTPFPEKLGNKLNNPHFTVDFSESQLEIITSVKNSSESLYNHLLSLTRKAEDSLEGETLWPFSMPGPMPGEKEIPLATFPEEMKHKEVYRRGLVSRYGSYMQMISGIHYNFSFTLGQIELLKNITPYESKDEIYLAMARNFMRYRWFFLLHSAASPLVTQQYLQGRKNVLDDLESCCECYRNREYLNTALSYRMSPLGYQSAFPQPGCLSYNSLEDYVDVMHYGLTHRSQNHRGLGESMQLNKQLLQNESEFYAPIRLKGLPGQPVLSSLKEQGIHYLELRSIDLNPLDPAGISLDQLRFFHLFLLFCLLEESPSLSSNEMFQIGERDHSLALWGRAVDWDEQEEPITGLNLKKEGQRIIQRLHHWAETLGFSPKYIPMLNSLKENFLYPERLLANRVYKLFKEDGWASQSDESFHGTYRESEERQYA